MLVLKGHKKAVEGLPFKKSRVVFWVFLMLIGLGGVLGVSGEAWADANSTFHIEACIDTSRMWYRGGGDEFWENLPTNAIVSTGVEESGKENGKWCIKSGLQNDAQNPTRKYEIEGAKLDYSGNKLSLTIGFYSNIEYYGGIWGGTFYRDQFDYAPGGEGDNIPLVFCQSRDDCMNSGVHDDIEADTIIGPKDTEIVTGGMVYKTPSKDSNRMSTNSLGEGQFKYSGTVIFKTYSRVINNKVYIDRCFENGTGCVGIGGDERPSTNANIRIKFYDKRTFVATPVDGDGKTLSGVTCSYSSDVGVFEYGFRYGSKVSARCGGKSGYTFMGWSTNKSGISSCAEDKNKCSNINDIYTIGSLTTNKKVYAVYAKPATATATFSGQGVVSSGQTTASTDWIPTGSVNVKSLRINCGSTKCNATFKFKIHRRTGSDKNKTKYRIYRVPENDQPNQELVKSSTSSGGTVFSEKESIEYGHKMCYRMKFWVTTGLAKWVKTCARVVYTPPKEGTFEGRVKATSGGSIRADTGYDKKKASGTIKNCENGCAVRFDAYLNRTSGTESTTYSITVDGKTVVSDRNYTGSIGSPTRVRTESVTIYNGQTTCMTLKYKTPYNAKNDTTRTACVKAEKVLEGCGEIGGLPDSYKESDEYEGTTSTASGVRNNTTSTGWKDDAVYAKPGDNVEWMHCYYPGVQTTANTYVTVRDSHDKDEDKHYNSLGKTCSKWDSYCYSKDPYRLEYQPLKKLIDWGNSSLVSSGVNKYTQSLNEQKSQTVRGADFKSPFVNSSGKQYNGDTGDNTFHEFKENNYQYKVEGKYVGRTLFEEVKKTSSPRWAKVFDPKSHPWSCGWDKTGSEFVCADHSAPLLVPPEAEDSEEPGEPYYECADNSIPSDTDTYGWTKTCTHTGDRYNGDFVEYDFDNNDASTSASVIVPYNYINEPEITMENDDDAYAGETKSIVFKVTTKPKKNDVTDPDNEEGYATIVDNAQYKILVYAKNYGDGKISDETDPELLNGGVLNAKYDMGGDELEDQSEVGIPDVPAGTIVCAKVLVWPATSGDDKNTDPDGDKNWADSKEKCFRVAKKPSLQVWGGNVYSNGGISTDVSKKGHVEGSNGHNGKDSEFDADRTSSTRYFGSFGELGVLAVGSVKGFSSGAGTGYARNDNGRLIPAAYNNDNDWSGNSGGEVGGSTSGFCSTVTLSFANKNCSEDKGVGKMFGSVASKEIAGDRKMIYEKFIEEADSNVNNVKVVNGNKNVEDIESEDGDLNIMSIGSSTTRLLIVKGKATIGTDIQYYDSDDFYYTLEEIPKYIIYADDIDIKCEVERIDALLITAEGGKIDTCSDAPDDLSSEERSVQLRIFGALVTDRLVAGRTYGASTGANSIIPAEIIQFDPTLYLLGASVIQSNDADTNASNMEITHIKESAPRY